jgi:stage II sporulation protein D
MAVQKQPMQPLKRYGWLVLPLVGGVVCGAAVLALQPQPDVAIARAGLKKTVPDRPQTPPTPIASPIPLPTPKPSVSPTVMPSLTAEQQALNQQYKTSFESASVDSNIEMHVAIAEGVSTLTVSTTANATLLNKEGQVLQSLSAGRPYTLGASGQSLKLGDSALPQVVMLDPSPTGLFTLGDRTYHGRLLLVAESGAIWAVNFVNLRQYLHSVVASEVSPSWPMEALKAQAVAARSYALTHFFRPASSLYHLGATQRHQVYSGIEREAEPTTQAVDATSGQFVSYRGGVVESLYAASDDIVARAFQGHGMSQLGALDLAKQGYTYEQILSNYYPNTGIGQIEMDME